MTVEDYIKHGTEKKIVRKIFQNVTFDSFENAKIDELMAYMRENDLNPPEGYANNIISLSLFNISQRSNFYLAISVLFN